MAKQKSKKLTKKQIKEKQVKTLAKMKKNREIDSNCLRDLITKKFEWAQVERKKGLDMIKNHQDQINEIKKQIHRLDGMLIFIKTLLALKEE